jgi:glycosyltransferase involved in cell wall biosynthesis
VKVIRPSHAAAGLRGHVWEQFLLPRALEKEQFLWSPANTGPMVVTRQAVTIHDLSVLDHPEWFATGFRIWYMLLWPRLARNVRVILTVSEHSRRSILRRFGLPEDKVVAIPNGVNLQQFHPVDPTLVRNRYGLGKPYMLFVGSLDPRKNLDRLLQAWFRLPEFKDVELVIAGARRDIFQPVSMPYRPRRTRFLGYVPDDDLPGLYAGATFFIMPSLFEGFGLTVLEAMACGTPVISSYAGALPEVTGTAAIQVDPTSPEAMAEAMRTLLVDEGMRANLRQKGLDRAARFSWERSARQISEVLASNA